MSRDTYIGVAVGKWVREHRRELAAHGIRDGEWIVDVGAWLALEGELVAEATRLWNMAQYGARGEAVEEDAA